MDLSPEIKQQLEAQKANCIFCKMISGEADASKVYEDEELFGVLDINPAIKGHTLLIPKEHLPILPFLPPKTFKHLFGKLPSIAKALKKAMLATGITIFIANGGVAGQQAQHFLMHLLPREEGDPITKFAFCDDKTIDSTQLQQVNQALAQNLPAMMQNHFKRQPANWHSGTGERPEHFKQLKNIFYEDEKVIVAAAEKPQCIGHMVIHPKESESFEGLSAESSSHCFYVASYAATAVFEGLKAHGSNIILQSGKSTDNPDGKLEIHVLPRYPDDGLDLFWAPLTEKPDMENTRQKIYDELFIVANQKPEETETVETTVSENASIKPRDLDDPLDEVRFAIEQLQKKP